MGFSKYSLHESGNYQAGVTLLLKSRATGLARVASLAFRELLRCCRRPLLSRCEQMAADVSVGS